jgi:hypothetical protein
MRPDVAVLQRNMIRARRAQGAGRGERVSGIGSLRIDAGCFARLCAREIQGLQRLSRRCHQWHAGNIGGIASRLRRERLSVERATHLLQRWMGHASLRSPSIYADVIGPDERSYRCADVVEVKTGLPNGAERGRLQRFGGLPSRRWRPSRACGSANRHD